MKTRSRRAGSRTVSTSFLGFNPDPVRRWTGMWRGCFPASPKSFPTHQTPSAFHSAALKILSSSALCLKETPEKCVCVCGSVCTCGRARATRGCSPPCFHPVSRSVQPRTALRSPPRFLAAGRPLGDELGPQLIRPHTRTRDGPIVSGRAAVCSCLQLMAAVCARQPGTEEQRKLASAILGRDRKLSR